MKKFFAVLVLAVVVFLMIFTVYQVGRRKNRCISAPTAPAAAENIEVCAAAAFPGDEWMPEDFLPQEPLWWSLKVGTDNKSKGRSMAVRRKRPVDNFYRLMFEQTRQQDSGMDDDFAIMGRVDGADDELPAAPVPPAEKTPPPVVNKPDGPGEALPGLKTGEAEFLFIVRLLYPGVDFTGCY